MGHLSANAASSAAAYYTAAEAAPAFSARACACPPRHRLTRLRSRRAEWRRPWGRLRRGRRSGRSLGGAVTEACSSANCSSFPQALRRTGAFVKHEQDDEQKVNLLLFSFDETANRIKFVPNDSQAQYTSFSTKRLVPGPSIIVDPYL
jgi:hypothetical protein